MVALSSEVKWRKEVLDKRNSSPIGWTLFRLLSNEEFISMANFIGADFRTAIGVRGYDTATIKTRAAWDAQAIALLIALNKKEIHGNFLETIVPTDKDAIKSIKAIEEFNIESTKSVYDGANWLLHKVSYEMLVNPLKSSEVLRRNQRISQAVLVLVYKYLNRYCKSLKISSKEVLSRDSINWLDFNSWDDFFGEYKEEMARPLNCILKGWIKTEKIKSRQLLEMVKKFILFNYSISFGTYNIDKLNYEYYPEAIINEVHSIAAIGRALYPIYCNVHGIKQFIEECFPEIKKSKVRSKIIKEIKLECTSSLTIEELAQLSLKEKNSKTHEKKEIPKVSNKYPIPKGFKEAHAKYYNKEITMYKFSSMFHVSDTKIREWMKECNLPLRPRGAKKGKSVLDVQNEQKPTVQEFSVEPTVQVLPVEKPTFSFSLFGYKFSFTAKKEKPPKSVNIADEFPDEIEY